MMIENMVNNLRDRVNRGELVEIQHEDGTFTFETAKEFQNEISSKEDYRNKWKGYVPDSFWDDEDDDSSSGSGGETNETATTASAEIIL